MSKVWRVPTVFVEMRPAAKIMLNPTNSSHSRGGVFCDHTCTNVDFDFGSDDGSVVHEGSIGETDSFDCHPGPTSPGGAMKGSTRSASSLGNWGRSTQLKSPQLDLLAPFVPRLVSCLTAICLYIHPEDRFERGYSCPYLLLLYLLFGVCGQRRGERKTSNDLSHPTL